MADRAGSQNKPSRKTTMVRLVMWSVWFSSGIMVLILLGAIVVTLLGKPTLSHNNGTSEAVSPTHPNSINQGDEELNKLIMQLHNRKGYSNPTPSTDDDEVITRKPRRRRPLKPIGKDFDPNKSYIIKYPNGTLSYVFPSDSSSSTTSMPTTISSTPVDPIAWITRHDINDTNDVSDSPVPAEAEEYPTEFPTLSHNNGTSVTESTTHSNDEELNKLIMQLHNRKGYSNPTPSPDDDDEEITRKPRRRRPLKRIDKDFDPNKSYVIRHPNGTLSFVFPTDSSSSTTSMPITISATPVDPISLKSRLDTNDTNDVPDSTVPPEDQYPTAFVNEIMHNHSTSFEGAFGEDVVIQDGDVLNTRFDEDIEYLCENVVELKRLKSGETRDKTNVMIINTDDFIQGVRIETCRFPGEPCKFCEFDTECRQTYHYRTLVAVDKRTNKPYKEQIKLPSSCKCGRRLT